MVLKGEQIHTQNMAACKFMMNKHENIALVFIGMIVLLTEGYDDDQMMQSAWSWERLKT
jgi:hypothetical protein